MKALVVFESFFGNTEKIARSVASQLGAEVLPANQLQPNQLSDIDLLVVGSPTRGFQPSPDTKAFLKSLPKGILSGKKVAAFDTRLSPEAITKSPAILRFLVNIFGYAAEPIAKTLVRKGGALVLPPEGFLVPASEGPLEDGELERSATWAEKMASEAS